jgi:hypothetical protein
MARAAFLYLGQDQTAARVQVLADSWAWLSGADREARVRAVLESAAEVAFLLLANAEETAAWPAGRAFGAFGELTWRAEDGLTHLVLVSDRNDLPEPFRAGPEPEGLRLAPAGDSPVLDEAWLWGTRQADGTWRETRVPGALSYPLEGAGTGQNAALLAKRYRLADASDRGMDDFVRYMDVAARTVR